EIAEVMEAGRAAGALLPLLSGSGPTIGFLARDAHHALDLAVLLQATRGVNEALRATGPAPGAHVVDRGQCRTIPWRVGARTRRTAATSMSACATGSVRTSLPADWPPARSSRPRS